MQTDTFFLICEKFRTGNNRKNLTLYKIFIISCMAFLTCIRPHREELITAILVESPQEVTSRGLPHSPSPPPY